jgi:Tfp pilus assembly protein PilP
MKRTLREILLLLHVAGCRKSVDQYLADVERAKRGLEKSLAALDAAKARLTFHDHEERSPIAPPKFLLKGSK